MKNIYILSHDIGTTGLKSCIYNHLGELLGSVYKKHTTYYPKPNYIEQEPEEWWRNFCFCTKKLIKDLNIKSSDIECICLSGHMNGVVPVDINGNLLRKRTFLWADSRSKEESIFLEKKIGYENFFNITGGGQDTVIYPAAKILWIKKNEYDIYKRIYKVLGTKDYIILKLTGRFLTDYSDASNYGLMDIFKREWSLEILSALDITKSILPEIHNSYEIAGGITREASNDTGLKQGTKVVIGGGDVVCASVGAGAVDLDTSYFNLGSASWVSKNFNKPVLDLNYRPFNLCHIIKDLYASQVSMFGGAICYQWILNLLGTEFDIIELKFSKKRDNNKKLLFLPFIRGGGAPYFNINSKGVFIGLTVANTKEDLIKAVFEGVAFNLRSLFEFLKKYNNKMDETRAIGGGALSKYWCQIISNVCDIKIIRPYNLQETTSFGAAITGGVGVGLFKDFDVVHKLLKVKDRFYPDKKKLNKYMKLYNLFLEAIESMDDIFNKLAEID